jgi:hypothetical protein
MVTNKSVKWQIASINKFKTSCNWKFVTVSEQSEWQRTFKDFTTFLCAAGEQGPGYLRSAE